MKSEEMVDKVTWFWMLVLAAGLPLLVNPFGMDFFTLPKLFLLELVVLALLFLNLLRALLSGKIVLVGSPLSLPLAAFLVLTLASTFFSIAPHRSFYGVYQYKEGFLVILSYAMIYILTINFIRSRKQVEYLLLGLAGAAVLVSLYGFFQYFQGFSGWRYTETRVFSTISNPVYLGAYLALILPLVFSFLFYSSRAFRFTWFKPAVYLAIAVILGCLLLTLTRAAWLGTLFGLGAAIYLIEEVKKHSWVLAGFFIVALVTVLLFMSLNPSPGRFLDRLESLFQIGRQTETARLFLWKTSLEAIAKRPLYGYGLQTFGLVYPITRSADWTKHDTEKTGSEKVHNDLLQMAVSSGLLGMLAYLWVLTILLMIGFQRVKRLRENALAAGLMASVFAYLLNLQFNFTMVEVTPLFWLIAGLAVFVLDRPGKPLLSRRDIKMPLSLSESGARVGALLLALACLFFVYQAARPLTADIYANQAMKLEMKGAYGPATESLKKAVKLSTGEIFYYQLLGSLLEQQSIIGGNIGVFELGAGAYQNALKIDPRNSVISLVLGDLYVKGAAKFEARLLEKALQSYNAGLKNDPNNPMIWARLGIAYAYQGSFELAVKCMRKSIELDPQVADHWFNLGLLYEGLGMSAEARQSYREALRLDPRMKQAKEALERLGAI